LLIEGLESDEHLVRLRDENLLDLAGVTLRDLDEADHPTVKGTEKTQVVLEGLEHCERP
jgi:hypothetical protein